MAAWAPEAGSLATKRSEAPGTKSQARWWGAWGSRMGVMLRGRQVRATPIEPPSPRSQARAKDTNAFSPSTPITSASDTPRSSRRSVRIGTRPAQRTPRHLQWVMPNAAGLRHQGLRRRAGRVRLRVLRWYPIFFLSNLPRALRPRLFADYVRRKMLFDRRPYLVETADKARVREYVRAKVGEHVLTKAYAITEDPGTIDWSTVPRNYVCKATHGSGGVIVVNDHADPDARLPTPEDRVWARAFVRPEHAPHDQVVEVCRRWLRQRYGTGPATIPEWQYRHITPRILVEELLQRPDGAVANDYNLYVFHGRCEHICVTSDRMDDLRIDFFRPDWTPVEVHGKSKRADVQPPKPAKLDEMVRIAEALGAETDFVRVDLYDVGDRIVFGELTNTPNGGLAGIDRNYERWLGSFCARGR